LWILKDLHVSKKQLDRLMLKEKAINSFEASLPGLEWHFAKLADSWENILRKHHMSTLLLQPSLQIFYWQPSEAGH